MTLSLTGIAPLVLDGMHSNPLHRASGMAVRRAANGQSEISFEVNDFTANLLGALHGGILYSMMDVGCFMAMASQLEPGRHGVTVDIQVSVLRPAMKGETVLVRGRVDRIGRTLANLRAEAWVAGEQGERLIGTATVLKSLMDLPPAS